MMVTGPTNVILVVILMGYNHIQIDGRLDGNTERYDDTSDCNIDGRNGVNIGLQYTITYDGILKAGMVVIFVVIFVNTAQTIHI